MKLIGKIALLIGATLFCFEANAQIKKNDNLTPWYVGASGGISFGSSTFTSFGADKIDLGFNAGAFVGYNINSIFSAEISGSYGQMGLYSTKCSNDYWLENNGDRHEQPVPGATGNYYRDLYSTVTFQQYGLRFNVDLISLFIRNKINRLSVMISPAVYGVGTNSTIKTIVDGNQYFKPKTQFNFGAGGDIMVGYRITENLSVRISSGINQVLGSRIDGLEECGHKDNFIWNNNVSISWRFGKRKPKTRSSASTTTDLVYKKPVEEVVVIEEKVKEVEETIEVAEEVEIITPIEIAPIEKVRITAPSNIAFPKIYFDFDKVEMTPTQKNVAYTILDIAKANPDMKITITGYADKYGSKDVNGRYSKNRAKALQKMLVERGIDASRITTIGGGTDPKTPTGFYSRRVEVMQDL